MNFFNIFPVRLKISQIACKEFDRMNTRNFELKTKQNIEAKRELYRANDLSRSRLVNNAIRWAHNH